VIPWSIGIECILLTRMDSVGIGIGVGDARASIGVGSVRTGVGAGDVIDGIRAGDVKAGIGLGDTFVIGVVALILGSLNIHVVATCSGG